MTAAGTGWVRIAAVLEAQGLFSALAAAGWEISDPAPEISHYAGRMRAQGIDVQLDGCGHPCIPVADVPVLAAAAADEAAAVSARLEDAYRNSAAAEP